MIDATAKEMLAKADALLPGGGETVDAALLDLCPNCRVVTANAVGYATENFRLSAHRAHRTNAFWNRSGQA